MKKIVLNIFLPLVLLFAVTESTAQVSVIITPSPAKQFFIDDIWKTTLINASTSSTNVIVQCQIKTGGSMDVLTIITQPILLTSGANHLNAIESGSAKWVYGNTSQSTILQSTGKLPFGQYVLSITVTSITGKLLGSNNEEMEVAPMFPPQLMSPSNEEVVSIKYPVLSWIAPHPMIEGIAVVYSLRLVALQSGQSPAEGLLQNPPLLNMDNLSSTSLNYPVTAQELQPGITYAWQVAASYEGYSLGTTEIWTFTIKPLPPPPSDDIIYPVASKVSDGHYYVTKGIFRFAYDNKANDKKLTYVIKQMDKKRENLKTLPELEIKPGTNKLEIDARHNTGMKEKQYYDLEITDSKGQVYKVLFYYITE